MKDEQGKRYGHWEVLHRLPVDKHADEVMWQCRCLACGTEKPVKGSSLRRGVSTSCCQADRRANPITLQPEYPCWASMRQRCGNPAHPDYRRYGGRGITVVPEWNDYKTFLAAVGKRPTMAHTLERLNVNGHYEPGNVTWAPKKQQARNRRNNRRIEFQGVSGVVAEWAEALGINYETLIARLNSPSFSLAQALTAPIDHRYSRRKA